jgi:prepilin-type processing-associated H-X9-DG protein
MKSTPSRLLPEILVTGLIILIVAYIIARTYTGSIAQANRVSCLNNATQLGRAIQEYATDHDQLLPLGPSWQDVVMRYVADPPDWNLYYCPARVDERGYSYGMNPNVAGCSDPAIIFPADTVLVADVKNATRAIWWVNDYRFIKLRTNKTPYPCHVRRANFAYCDGHAKSSNPTRLEAVNWAAKP